MFNTDAVLKISGGPRDNYGAIAGYIAASHFQLYAKGKDNAGVTYAIYEGTYGNYYEYVMIAHNDKRLKLYRSYDVNEFLKYIEIPAQRRVACKVERLAVEALCSMQYKYNIYISGFVFKEDD